MTRSSVQLCPSEDCLMVVLVLADSAARQRALSGSLSLTTDTELCFADTAVIRHQPPATTRGEYSDKFAEGKKAKKLKKKNF